MPDWSYQPLFRPLLMRLPPEVARDLTLGAICTLARLPGGTGMIALLGHMDPPSSIATSLCGIPLRSPVGMAAGVDPHLLGTRALARIGFGFLEVGPVTLEPLSPATSIACDPTAHEIALPDSPWSDGLEVLEKRLASLGQLPVPLLVRLARGPRTGSVAEICALAERLRPWAAAFVVEVGASPAEDVAAVRQAAPDRPILIALRTETGPFELAGVLAAGADGYLVGGGLGTPHGRRILSRDAMQATLEMVAVLRSRLGPAATIVAEGGIEEPADALALHAAGASLVQLHSGLIFSGPGLPKRINEAFAARVAASDQRSRGGPAASDQRSRGGVAASGPHIGGGAAASDQRIGARAAASDPRIGGRAAASDQRIGGGAAASDQRIGGGAAASDPRIGGGAAASDPRIGVGAAASDPRIGVGAAASEQRIGGAWRWHLLLGLSMIVGGCLAWLVAAVSVTLPYDDAYLGLDRVGLAALSPRILSFMAHDRVTLAGTMLSIGVLYTQLAWWGMRRGAHWAWKAVVVSAGVGFASFFLFLGFGYFDPLHAAVSIILFGFFLAGLSGRPRGLGPLQPGLRNDRAWWLGLYGQLCFVAIGVGLMLAGLTIAGVGVTTVFVPEDLTFLRADPDLLRAANAHLLPLIAHDRAGFGGALVSDGLAVLLVALWGFRRGAAWLWWTLLLAGVPGFGAAIGVHAAVGYADALHLAPVFVAVVLYLVGLALSCEFLCGAERSGVELLRRAEHRGAIA